MKVRADVRREVERETVEAAVDGDLAAFERIYETLHLRVLHYIAGVLYRAGLSCYWTDAEDLTQEVFLNAFRAIRKGQFHLYTNVPVTAWFFKLAENETRSFFRRRRFLPLSEGLEKRLAYTMEEDVIVQLVVLSRYLTGLSPLQQQVLALTSFGYRTVEVAWVLGLPSTGDVKVLRVRGRLKLRGKQAVPDDSGLSQMYLVVLTFRTLVRRIRRGKSFWNEGDLEKAVLSNLRRLRFPEYQISKALAGLPEGFFDRLAALHTIPRKAVH